jgi:hypothetical protein
MAELRIGTLENSLVLYFETPEKVINAYALASTLVGLADAAKAAGRTLNSAIDIEIVVEAVASGSFKAKISAFARESGLFIKQQAIPTLVLGVLANYIYDHTLAKKSPIEVVINTDEVVIVQGENRIVVPRQVHEATQEVARNPAFVRSVDRMLGSIMMDPRITGFGIAATLDSPPPEVILPRDLLDIRDKELEPEDKTRVIEEDCDLYIVKAIMESSKRKWGFKWRGIPISAPITDPSFYDDFAHHNFTIAPGDEFQAKLAIHQVRDDVSGVFTNKSYEVVHVYRHISRPKTQHLPLN